MVGDFTRKIWPPEDCRTFDQCTPAGTIAGCLKSLERLVAKSNQALLPGTALDVFGPLWEYLFLEYWHFSGLISCAISIPSFTL